MHKVSIDGMPNSNHNQVNIWNWAKRANTEHHHILQTINRIVYMRVEDSDAYKRAELINLFNTKLCLFSVI